MKTQRCFNCNGHGHLASSCPRPQKTRVNNVNQAANKEEQSSSVDSVQDSMGAVGLYYIEEVNQLSGQGNLDGLSVDLKVEGVPLSREIDTGPKSATLIGRPLFLKYFSSKVLSPAKPLCSCTGEPLDLMGVVDVNVTCNGVSKVLPLTVVNGKFPSLMGLPWIQQLPIDWNRLFSVNCVGSVTPVKESDKDFLSRMQQKYPEPFSDKFGVIKDCEVNIRLVEGSTPVFCSARSIPFPMMETVKTELDNMERKGYLKKVSGPSAWGSPIVPVPKGNGVRVCGDYSGTVNPQISRKHFTLPVIDDLTTINGAVFCSLDFSEAFQQLKLSPASSKILALSTPWGIYQPQTLQYGVNIAPEEFQAKVMDILSGIRNTFIYLDNVLCWGQSKEECKRVVEQILAKLQQYNVRLNKAKCEWLVSSVSFLGYLLDSSGLRAHPDKVRSLREAKVPQNIAELRSFIGHVNFYGKCAEHMSTVLHPLQELVNSGEWRWTSVEQTAYEEVIQEIGSKVLVPYSLDLPLRLTSDASQVGVGVVLTHLMPDGTERPIVFASKTFTSAELNYPQHEREALGVIFGIKKFSKYLIGRNFEILTDNKALVSIFETNGKHRPNAVNRLRRWQILLSAFRYSIAHARGVEIPHADHLSRLPEKDDTPVEEAVNFVDFTELKFVSARDVAAETARDPLCSKILFYVQHGWPEDIPADLQVFRTHYLELSAQNGCLLRGHRVIIPDRLRPDVLALLHDMHPGMGRMKSLARGYVWWPDLDKNIESMVAQCNVCQALHRDIPHDPFVPWTWASRRWQRIFVDFAHYDGTDILVLIDHHSRWPEARVVRSLGAADVCEVLRSIFAAYGLPEELVSDNGSPFASREFAEFLRLNQIRHLTSPVCHPPSNGMVEKSVGTVKKSLEKQCMDGRTAHRSLQHKIDAWLFHQRNTPHSATKASPAELFLGRKPRTHLSVIHPGQVLKERMTTLADRTAAKIPARREGFQPGDSVWLKTINHRKLLWVPGIVDGRVSAASCDVMAGRRLRHVSTSFLRHRVQSAEEPPPFQGDEPPSVEMSLEAPSAAPEVPPSKTLPIVPQQVPVGPSMVPESQPNDAEPLPVPVAPSPPQIPGSPRVDTPRSASPPPPSWRGPFAPVTPAGVTPKAGPPVLSPAMSAPLQRGPSQSSTDPVVVPTTPRVVRTRSGREVMVPRNLRSDFVLK